MVRVKTDFKLPILLKTEFFYYRFEHPANAQKAQTSGTFGNQTWTAPAAGTTPPEKNTLFNVEILKKDFTPQVDKPIWPLSSYGPAKHEPILIPNLDESPEELRVRALTAMKAGTADQYTKYEAEKIAAADLIYANALAHVVQAYEQAVKQSTSLVPTVSSTVPAITVTAPTTSTFGTNALPATSAFGQPSAFGALANKPSTTSSVFGGGTTPAPATISSFGKPAFGQPAFGQSVFGQTSTAQAPISVFGQPSTTQVATSAFSQPSTRTATSAFGQPPTAQASTSAFGQPSAAQPSASAFGQLASTPSAFGQVAPATSAFGQPQTTPAFGQTTQPQSSLIKPASGAFGNATGGTTSAVPAAGTGGGGGFSSFAGQPSAFGLGATLNATNKPPDGGSVFGQTGFGNQPAAASGSVFGNTPAAVPAPAASAFGKPSVFGQPQAVSAFGVSAFTPGSGGSAFSQNNSNTPAVLSPFAPQPPAQQQLTTGSVFAPSQPPKPIFGQPQPQPPRSVFGQLTPSQPSTQPMKPKSGPPDFASAKSTYKPGADKYDALLPENYLQLLPGPVKEAFESATFQWGRIPEWIPPKELR